MRYKDTIVLLMCTYGTVCGTHAHWWGSLWVVNICTDKGGTWAMQTNDCFSIFFYLEYSAGVLLFEYIYVPT